MQGSSNKEYMATLSKWESRDATYLGAEPPLVFAKGEASTIWDVEGKAYFDMCAGFGVLALGHNSQVQQRVFQQTLEESLVVHAMGDVYPSRDKIELLAYMGKLLPTYLNKGTLALSGGQAVEIAVKTAQMATGKQGFICFEGSYHGLDLGILPLTSRNDFKDPFRAWIPGRYVSELPHSCSVDLVLEAIAAQKKSEHGCAAVVVEPIQGRAGVRLPHKGWLEALSTICRSEGVLLIYDEVFTGLGRTGQITFGEEAPCDLLCLGKALGGGLPLSACFGREDVMNAWPENRGEAIHTGTFFGHPLSCRLGLETMRAIVDEKLLDRSKFFGEKMRRDLRAVLGKHPSVCDIRGLGMMTGIELREAGAGALWMDRLRLHGVVALASGMQGQGLSLTPSLTLSENDWDAVLEILVRTL